MFSKAASRTILLSYEREEPNPVLHQPTLKKKSNYLMKFNPTLEILTTYKLLSQCFSSANLLKLSVAEVCPLFFPYSKIAREKLLGKNHPFSFQKIYFQSSCLLFWKHTSYLSNHELSFTLPFHSLLKNM